MNSTRSFPEIASISRFPIVLLLLGASAALIFLLTANFQMAPGYMDAEYYFAGGQSLASGKGFTEDFVWNYLNDPQGIPQPSHQYWMPLASLLTAVGIRLSGAAEFTLARWPFLLLAVFVPIGTAILAHRLAARHGDGDGVQVAVLAGFLAVFPAFYLAFLTTSETFAIYMLLGLAFLFAVGEIQAASHQKLGLFFLLGLLSAGMHLARADGLLWLALAFFIVLMGSIQENRGRRRAPPEKARSLLVRLFSGGLAVALGYLLVMGPWFVRNWNAFGGLLAPGGARVLWLTGYDELYAYPAGQLTFDRWWQSGWQAILQARIWAFGQNLQTAFAVQGSIFLAPLILLGAWRLRSDRIVQLGLAAWLLTFLSMTLVFPYAGARGGFFHAGAAVQPLFWALAPFGLQTVIFWGSRSRGWHAAQARQVFSIGIIGLAVLLSALLFQSRVIGEDPGDPVWNAGSRSYTALEADLKKLGAQTEEIVMVNNPPGYHLASGRPAIVIPDGGETALTVAARRYSAAYLILEANHPDGLAKLYQNPGDRSGLQYLGSFHGAQIFSFTGSGS